MLIDCQASRDEPNELLYFMLQNVIKSAFNGIAVIAIVYCSARLMTHASAVKRSPTEPGRYTWRRVWLAAVARIVH